MVTEAERNTPDDELIAALREYLDYDAETGALTWRLPPAQCVKSGSLAGSRSDKGYLRVGFRSRLYMAHHVVWALAHGRWSEKELDHINRVRDDNRLDNLRECDRAENMQNQGIAGRGSNRLIGASFDKTHGKFTAKIRKDNRQVHLGHYDPEEEAHAVYLAAKRRLHTFNPEIAT